MKFTVDIEDFWLDEDADLTESLKAHVVREVVAKISKSIEDQVTEKITKKAEEAIKTKLDALIDSTLSDLIASQTIVRNKEEISIVSYIRQVFTNSDGWNNPEGQIKKFAKEFGEEMKLQYNAAFANQIVANMKEQGFLKDEVTQILLGGKK